MKLKAFLRLLTKNFILHRTDPLIYCPLGMMGMCCHVDSPICNFPHCNMFKETLRVYPIKEKE